MSQLNKKTFPVIRVTSKSTEKFKWANLAVIKTTDGQNRTELPLLLLSLKIFMNKVFHIEYILPSKFMQAK